MRKIFEQLNFSITNEQYEKFNKFKKYLLECNKKFNLTAIIEDNEINVKHFYDSLYGLNYLEKEKNIIEIGSGGGFPSIPIKIIREDLNFTLVESSNKKCEYLKSLIKNLKLKNISVICERAENLGKNKNYREKFDYTIARAVSRLNTLCEYCLPLIKKNGEMIAYKGSDCDEELKESSNAITILGGKLNKVINYELPNNFGKRNLVIIRKIDITPIKYPRGNGKEKNKPL